MSLMRFNYLHKRRILTLTVILTLISTLFTITAFSFLGLYNGFTNYVGEEKDVLAVYGTKGSTPLTGIIPIYLTDNISQVPGVIACSPETIAPSIIKGQSVFIRGIVPQEFSMLNKLTIVEGEALNLSDLNSAIVGQRLSDRLNLKIGDKITIFGVLSRNYADLKVKGIYQSGSVFDDEALVPIYVGQWLRGLSYNEGTVLRVKIDQNQVNTNKLHQVIANASSQNATPTPTQPKSDAQKELEQLVTLSKTNFDLKTVGVDEAQNLMKSYLDQYGVSKDTLIGISVVVLVFASGTAACALSLFVNQHEQEISILRSVGASIKQIKSDLLAKVVFWSTIASAFGTILGTTVLLVFERTGYLLVLSHRINFQLDPLIIAANFLLISAILAAGVIRSEMKR